MYSVAQQHLVFATLKFVSGKHICEDFPRTDTLIENLANKLLNSMKTFKLGESALFKEPYFDACGCLGKEKDSDVACPCEIASLIYQYRWDIALYIKQNMEKIAVSYPSVYNQDGKCYN